MTTKGEMTKAYILENAKGLFSEKGYGAVTMKDFCDRCHLSRGGLYRYFGSPKEIFTTMLNEELKMVEKSVERWIQEGKSSMELMRLVFSYQIVEILKGEGAIDLAIYEYCKLENERSFILQRFDVSKRILVRILTAAQCQREVLPHDAALVAKRLLQYIEGIRISSNVMGYDENELLEDMLAVLESFVEIDRTQRVG